MQGQGVERALQGAVRCLRLYCPGHWPSDRPLPLTGGSAFGFGAVCGGIFVFRATRGGPLATGACSRGNRQRGMHQPGAQDGKSCRPWGAEKRHGVVSAKGAAHWVFLGCSGQHRQAGQRKQERHRRHGRHGDLGHFTVPAAAQCAKPSSPPWRTSSVYQCW